MLWLLLNNVNSQATSGYADFYFRGPGFGDSNRVIAEDHSHSSREKRYYCFGLVESGVLTVRFTYRDDFIRIFGAGFWRKGKQIYERENKIHERVPRKA